jgi:hypothetical protein
MQRELEIDEYTDSHDAATVPHTLVLKPGLVIHSIYNGYWFWGRPSVVRLWTDLVDLFQRTKADSDPTTTAARAAWQASLGAVEVRRRAPVSVSPSERAVDLGTIPGPMPLSGCKDHAATYRIP